MNAVARQNAVDQVGRVSELIGMQQQVVSAVIGIFCRGGLNRWMPLIGLAVLTGCGESGPVTVQPLSATVLPKRGDAIVVLAVPGVS